MNQERLEQLASIVDKLETGREPGQFDMEEIIHVNPEQGDCGTPACLIGWTLSLFGYDDAVYNYEIDDIPITDPTLGWSAGWAKARELLDLTYAQADELFCPMKESIHYLARPADGDRFITAKRAAAAIRHMADTGHVDWPRV